MDRSLRSRARQFAQVCSLTHEASGGTPNTLPSPDNAMFALIKTILLPGGVTGAAATIEGSPTIPMSSAQQAARAGAKELASALVEWYLELHDAAIMDLRGSELQQLHCLTALHIIASVDASLCMPQSDPAKLIRCLAAYLKERQFETGPSASGGSVTSTPQAAVSAASTTSSLVSADSIDLDRKRSAGRLLCIMHLITSVSRRLEHLDSSLCDSAGLDLSHIITRHLFIGVTAGACQCLCALVRLRPGLAVRVQEITARNYRFIDKELAAGSIHTSKARFNFSRSLTVLGHLCRHGSEIIDGYGEQMHSSHQPKSSYASGGSVSTLSSQPVTLVQVLTLFMTLYQLPVIDGDPFAPKLKEYALQAMGLLLIARPDLILEHPGVMSLFESALDSKEAPEIKKRALVNLTELLKAEEDGMFERQALANSAMSKRNQASILPAAALAAKPLARINGEGDAGSATSGVVQRLWKKVLLLTRDAPSPSSSEGQGQGQGGRVDGGALVRSRVLDLIEVVQRGGLTAPWQAVAPLVTLALDIIPETSHQAIKVLRQCVEKHSDFVGGELCPGLSQAYVLQKNLWIASHPPSSPSSRFGSALLPSSVVDHLGLLYQSAIQPHAALKQKLLAGLTRPFDDATNAVGPGALNSDLGLLWFLCWTATHIPYKRMDEPLTVLSAIGGIIARRGEACMMELKDAIEEEEDKRKAQGAAGPYPVSDRLVGAVKANIAMSLLYVTRQYIRQAYKLTDESRVAAYSGQQFLAFTPSSATAAEAEDAGSSPAPPSAPLPSSQLMTQSQAKKHEVKNMAIKDAKVEPPTHLTMIDLDAPSSLSMSLKSATEAYKTVKYLMKEDARLLTATSSGYEGMEGKGGQLQVLSTPVTAGGVMKPQRGRPRSALTAAAKISKPVVKGKRKKQSSDDEEEDEEDQMDEVQEVSEVTKGSRASSRVKAPRTN